MSSTQIKSEIHQIVDRLDESFLKVVHSMLDTYIQQQDNLIIGYDLEGEPLNAGKAKKEYGKRLAKIKKGEFSTVDQVARESTEW